MTKKVSRVTITVLLAMALVICSGCELSTKILISVDPPEIVLEQFFSALKENRYEACDSFLADNATFVVTDSTDYDFLGTLVDETVRHVSYEVTEEPRYQNLKATQTVRIMSLSGDDMTGWLKEHITQVEYDYMEKSGKNSIDPQNKEDVSNILSAAIEAYSENGQTITNTVTVHYVFSGNAWKIQVDSDFVTAVFGGVVDA